MLPTSQVCAELTPKALLSRVRYGTRLRNHACKNTARPVN